MADNSMIHMLLEQADRERAQAETEVQRAQSEALHALHQVQRLLDYQYTYRQRWGALFRKDSSEDMVQSYRSFMSRLQARIAMQERTARERARLANVAKEALKLQEKRMLAMQRMLQHQERSQPVGSVTIDDLQLPPIDLMDADTGMQRFSGIVDTRSGLSSFHTTIVDIDLPLIPSWQPLDAAMPRGTAMPRHR